MDIGVFGARAIPSTYSGYETFLTALLPELARRGHRVTMYCRSSSTSDRSDFQGVRLVSLPAVETKQLSTLTHGAIAGVAARLHRHDVVLVVNVANAPYCGLLRATGQRIVLNTDGQEWLRGKWGGTARRYFHWCARRAGWCASALVSDCREMRRIYLDEFKSESSVIPYPSGTLPPEDASVLTDLGVADRGYVMVAARLNPENNVDSIAEAYCRSDLDAPLLVLGAANYASEAADRIGDLAAKDERIRPVGHVADRGAFAALLSHALAYLHGHSVGGMNPSLVEAMTSGALIAALSTPFNREVLGPDGVYFDLEQDGLVSLLDRLGAMHEDDGEARRQAAQTRAAQRFSAVAVVDAYELLLSRTAALSRARDRVRIVTKWDDDDDG